MEPISIVKGIASVFVVESNLFSWCNGIDSGVAIVAIFASLILWVLSKLDGDIKRVNSDLKSLSDKIDAETRATNKRFDKIHGIILDIVLDKKKRKKKKDPKTDP